MNYEVSKPFPKPKSDKPEDLKIHAAELSHRTEQELRAIAALLRGQITITRNFSTGGSSSGGGGGSSTSFTRSGSLPVTGSGVATITFMDIGTNQYEPFVYGLKSDGDTTLAIPQVPPHSAGDSRTTNSFKVLYQEDCSLHWGVIKS